jgi:hypothetical protein
MEDCDMKIVLLLSIVSLLLSYAVFADDSHKVNEGKDNFEKQLRYEVEASNAYVHRKVIDSGSGMLFVDGVVAEPVDSFVWDGTGSTAVPGKAKLEIDPVNNQGEIKATWEDENGKWTYHQVMYSPPPHPTGLRLGSSITSTEVIEEDPITTNVYLHGDTGAGGPVLPTLFNLLATWGPAKVTLNGQPFNNPFDGPVPLWVGHTMTSVGARGDDSTVRTVSGDIYSPANSGEGAVDNDDLEFHIVFHDAHGPQTGNFPPPHSFFYHLSFEDVEVEIEQGK